MIQRIQSIWLLLSTALLVALFFSPYGHLVLTDLSSFPLEALKTVILPQDSMLNTCSKFIGIFSIHAFAFTLIAVFLFKNRKRQKRMVFASIFFKILVLVFLGIAFYQDGLPTVQKIHFHWAALFPIIAMLFDLLAVVGINKDEALIRSLDRIR